MELEVSPVAQSGNFIEFVAVLQKDASIYVYVGRGWLRFIAGKGQPEPYYDEADNTYVGEWLIYVDPISSKGGNWLLYQIDLQDTIQDTFGNDGWHFQNLRKVRLRNNLSLDYISVFMSQP
jgi:hypothetical protein